METIIDMFGNPIKVTDRMKAIAQATFCSDSHYKMHSFHFEQLNGHTVSVEEKINPEEVTVGQYNQHLLKQLKSLNHAQH